MNKSEMFKKIFDIDIDDCQDKQVCVSCGGDASEFKDELSRKEYYMSGLCQVCQDSIFE